MRTHLTQKQIQEYQNNGFIIIRGLLNALEIEKMHQLKNDADKKIEHLKEDFTENGITYNLECPDHLSVKTKGEKIEGKLRKIQEIFKGNSDFRDVCASDKILDIVEEIIGPKIYYHSSKFMCKQANGGAPKGWHQDAEPPQENRTLLYCKNK